MAKQDDYVRYTIRVPSELYEKLQNAAGEKSINAEINDRLETALAIPARIPRHYYREFAEASQAERHDFQVGLEKLLDEVFPRPAYGMSADQHWAESQDRISRLPEEHRELLRQETLLVCRLLAKDLTWQPKSDGK